MRDLVIARRASSGPVAFVFLVLAAILAPVREGRCGRLNAWDVPGPEGITKSGEHLYVTSAADGSVTRVQLDGKTECWFNLRTQIPGAKRAIPLGIVPDGKGGFYVAVQMLYGGSIVRISSGNEPSGEIVASRLGTVNGVEMDVQGKRLFVSDSGPLISFGTVGGRVVVFDIREGGGLQFQREIKNVRFANGLAFDAKENILYVSQTYIGFWGGRISRIKLGEAEPRTEKILSLQGWPDGLAWNADRKEMAICLQRAGKIKVFDPKSRAHADFPAKPGIASCVYLSPDRLAWTHFWIPNIATPPLSLLTKNVFYRDIYISELSESRCFPTLP